MKKLILPTKSLLSAKLAGTATERCQKLAVRWWLNPTLILQYWLCNVLPFEENEKANEICQQSNKSHFNTLSLLNINSKQFPIVYFGERRRGGLYVCQVEEWSIFIFIYKDIHHRRKLICR